MKTSATTLSLATLLALACSPDTAAEAHYGGAASLKHPRAGQYRSRRGDPFDMVSEMLRTPILNFNSFMKQEKEQAHLSTSLSPRYAVLEDHSVTALEMEVPGVLAKDIQIELEDDSMLRIKGTRRQKVKGSVEESEFDTAFTLAPDVDPTQLTVTLSAGILRVEVPKKKKTVKKFTIATPESSSDTNVLNMAAGSEEGRSSTSEEVDGLTITDENP